MSTEDGRFSEQTIRYLAAIEARVNDLTPEAVAQRVVELVEDHDQWRRRQCLNMIPAENALSRNARRLLDSDMAIRLTEGFPGDKEFPPPRHNVHIDEIEACLIALTKRLFGVRHIEWRPVNTTMANTAVYAAMAEPGDTMLVQAMDGGANMNYHPIAIPRVLRLEIVPMPATRTFEIDAEPVLAQARQVRPKVLVIGGGTVLFPYPIRDLRAIADEVGAYLFFDAAHLSLLIAAGVFQDPLAEGAHVLGLSTQKVLGGPVGGMALTNDAELARRIRSFVFPVLLQTRDLNKYAAQAYAMAEMVAFGADYARQMVANAKALGQALESAGFTVIGSDRGYTQTHQVVLDLAELGADRFENACQQSNILVHKARLMGDDARGFRTGSRLSVQELTRQGMRETEMATVARLIRRAATDRESADTVARDVEELLQPFQRIQFSFDQ
jgi:glycine hydroxymethyltransferase